MKRILAAALSLALLGSLAACGGKDRFDAGKVEEGVCYQLTGIAPDAVANEGGRHRCADGYVFL